MTNQPRGPTELEVRIEFGPKMRALNPMEQRWVLAKLENPMITNAEAARIAGYSDVGSNAKSLGHRLSHKPSVLEALKEFAEKMLASNVLMAAQVQTEILVDPGHKDRAKVAEMTLARAGLGVINRTHVTHEHMGMNKEELVTQAVELCKRLGLDPTKTLAAHGVVIDAEFQVVEPETENWEFEPDA